MSLVEWPIEKAHEVQAVLEQVYQWEDDCAEWLQYAHDQGWTEDEIKAMLQKYGKCYMEMGSRTSCSDILDH